MSILDSKGRLFGKISILDLGAFLVILLAIAGIFLPNSPGSIAQETKTQPIEVAILVRGLSVADPDNLVDSLIKQKTSSIVIRNQPAGEVKVKSVKVLPRTVGVPQPDGTIKALPDPRPEIIYSQDLIINIVGDGEITSDAPVLGGQKIKIGLSIELDGPKYNIKGSVIGVGN